MDTYSTDNDDWPTI